MSGYQDQSIYSHLNFVPKRKKRDVLHVIIQNTTCGYSFKKMVIEQNLQYEGRALFLVFIYLYNICTDFFLLKMKDELTSGMPENRLLFTCFGIWGFKKNNQSEISWYCFKIIIEVFQHFTLSNFLSCGNSLSLIFMSPGLLVQIRFSHIFLTALHFCLKRYWIISFCAEYSVTLGNVSDATWFWTSSLHLCQHPRNNEHSSL